MQSVIREIEKYYQGCKVKNNLNLAVSDKGFFRDHELNSRLGAYQAAAVPLSYISCLRQGLI